MDINLFIVCSCKKSMTKSLNDKLPEGLVHIGNSVYVDTQYPSVKDVLKGEVSIGEYLYNWGVRIDKLLLEAFVEW